MKICIILGTRPEIIKLSPIIKELDLNKINYFIIHTNQHYNKNLDKIFFQELNLSKAKYNLKVGSGKHGEMTGKMLYLIEKVLIKESPNIVLIQGDTNTVLAGGLAAKKLNIKIGHIESGLRSFDKKMPEEINRILVDHISDYLFTPTKNSKKNLLKEGLNKKNIYITGNTIVDSLLNNIKLSNKKSNILNLLNINKKNYILTTIHRQENVDNKKKLNNILNGLSKLGKYTNTKIIIPAHPRLVKMINFYSLKINNNIKIIDPVGYLDFIKLEKNSLIIATDSGGIQEEACILKIPCITLRENTERPETIKVGANILVGDNKNLIINKTINFIKKTPNWKNPYGKGNSAKIIIKIIKKII